MNNEESNEIQKLVELIQMIAVKGVAGTKPLEVRIGYVRDNSPIKIELIGGFCISDRSIILSDNVQDKHVEVEIDWETETASSHRHSIRGTKTMCIKNTLNIGDRVLILRKQGGEKHIVVSKI